MNKHFNMKTKPWWIKLEGLQYDEKQVVREFIKVQTGTCPEIYGDALYYTNYVSGNSSAVDTVMHGAKYLAEKASELELILKFKQATVIADIAYPTGIKLTESQLKIAELEKVMQDAQEKLLALKAIQGVK